MSNENVSSHSLQNMPPPTQSLYRSNSVNTTSYLNEYSNHYSTSRTDNSLHIKQSDEVHTSNYNIPHLKMSSSQNSFVKTTNKYASQMPQQNISSEKKNFLRENFSQQPQIYTTYSNSQLNSSSPQIIQNSPTQRLVQQQSPQTLQKQTSLKEIDSLNLTIPINHNQSNPQSELAQQLSAPPAVPIQQSISLQNTAFQIQSRPGLIKGLMKTHPVAYSSQENSSKSHQFSPQSSAIQVVNHHQTYIPSSMSQTQSSNNRHISETSNTHLLRNNNNVEDSSQSFYSQEIRQQSTEIYNNQQHLNLQNSQQPQHHVNSVVINDNGIVQSQYYQTRNAVQQLQPNNQITNKLIQTSSLSSGITQNHNSLVSNNSPQRIYVQHHQLNSTNQNSNIQLQQNKQTHYMTVPVSQQQKFHNVRQPSQQVLINNNNLIQSQSQVFEPTHLLQTSQQIVSNFQPTSNNVQNSSVYIGSQRFYSNSIIAAAAISNSSAPSSHGDGTLVASAPPLSNLSSISVTELISASDVIQPKKIYRNLKKKFKYLVYENEYYQEELRNLQRKLLKLSRDKNFLLDRLGSYETLSDSSDDSDASIKTIEDKSTRIRKKNKLANNNNRKKTTAVNVINGNNSVLNSTILTNNYTSINKRGCSMTISAAPPLSTSTILQPISTENSKVLTTAMQNSLLSINNVPIHYQQPPNTQKQNLMLSEKQKQYYVTDSKPLSPNSSTNLNLEKYSISSYNLPPTSFSKQKNLTTSTSTSLVKGLYVNSLLNGTYSKSNQPIEVEDEFQNASKVIVSSAAPPSSTVENNNDQNNSITFIQKFCDNENTTQQKNEKI